MDSRICLGISKDSSYSELTVGQFPQSRTCRTARTVGQSQDCSCTYIYSGTVGLFLVGGVVHCLDSGTVGQLGPLVGLSKVTVRTIETARTVKYHIGPVRTVGQNRTIGLDIFSSGTVGM